MCRYGDREGRDWLSVPPMIACPWFHVLSISGETILPWSEGIIGCITGALWSFPMILMPREQKDWKEGEGGYGERRKNSFPYKCGNA